MPLWEGMMLLKTAVAITTLICVPQFASAQDAAARYAASYKMFGFLLRMANVCPTNNKKIVAKAMAQISSPELVAFSKAYPKTIVPWMQEGAGFFNSGVMQFGIPTMCKEKD